MLNLNPREWHVAKLWVYTFGICSVPSKWLVMLPKILARIIDVTAVCFAQETWKEFDSCTFSLYEPM